MKHISAYLPQTQDIEKTLILNGYKQYTHVDGFTAWSKTNLCEYSDEWYKA